MSHIPEVLAPKADDVEKMLACQVHLGTRNLDPAMEQYVYKRRDDGVYIIDLKKTWEKLVLAARVMVAVENPSDVCVVSARPFGQRAVMKMGNFTGFQALVGRFMPGMFTNQIQKNFTEPRLLFAQDPRTDHQSLCESSYVNVPGIAFAHTDSPLRFVDIAIPCNNKARNAIGLMYWLLTREVLFLRGTLPRSKPWDVMVDLFIYRDPEDDKQNQDVVEQAPAPVAIEGAPEAGNAAFPPEQWAGGDQGQWDSSVSGVVGEWQAGVRA